MMSDENPQALGANEEFRSPSKVLPTKPSVGFDVDQLDMLSQVGKKAASMEALMRQSLYVKFDPLVDGEPTPVKLKTPAKVSQMARTMSEKLLDIDTPEVKTQPAQAAREAGSGPALAQTPLRSSQAQSKRDPMCEADNAPSSGSESSSSKSPSTKPQASQAATQPAASSSAASSGGKMYTESDVQRMIAEAVQQSQQETEILQMEIEDLQGKLRVEQENNAQMTTVVEEYGAAMAHMVENEQRGGLQLQADLERVEAEKAQVEQDLRKTETAFSDLHHKYEKLKELTENFKKNEKALTTALEQAQVALKQSEERYDALKAHAEEKIKQANLEIANVKESNRTQIDVANAKLKKSEGQIHRLERQLESKEKDNQELTSICDDLVKQLDDLTAKKG